MVEHSAGYVGRISLRALRASEAGIDIPRGPEQPGLAEIPAGCEMRPARPASRSGPPGATHLCITAVLSQGARWPARAVMGQVTLTLKRGTGTITTWQRL